MEFVQIAIFPVSSMATLSAIYKANEVENMQNKTQFQQKILFLLIAASWIENNNYISYILKVNLRLNPDFF